MKSRNPIAGNAWKYNKTKVIPDKKKKGEQRRIQRKFDYELLYDE